VGVKNFLIEGVSGTGKTAVCKELQRRGYHAINGDRELAYLGDPETGKPMDSLTHEPSAIFRSEHHIWDVEKVKTLVANQDEAATFLCGNSRNSSKFIDLFDAVFILEIGVYALDRRIDERVALDPTDWGATPAERNIIARLHDTKEAIPDSGVRIDATQPLVQVVDEILSKCKEAD
jgi:adenylate kinase family enzyme